MKKFLFVALLGGALVACNDTASTTSSEDSARIADSIKNATTPTTPDTSNSMMSTPSTDTGMMKSDTSSMKMMGDSMK